MTDGKLISDGHYLAISDDEKAFGYLKSKRTKFLLQRKVRKSDGEMRPQGHHSITARKKHTHIY